MTTKNDRFPALFYNKNYKHHLNVYCRGDSGELWHLAQFHELERPEGSSRAPHDLHEGVVDRGRLGSKLTCDCRRPSGLILLRRQTGTLTLENLPASYSLCHPLVYVISSLNERVIWPFSYGFYKVLIITLLMNGQCIYHIAHQS